MSRVAQQALFAAASAPAAISYVGVTVVPDTPSGNVTVLSVPIGAAASDRVVAILVIWYTSVAVPTLSAATIGGVAAAIHVTASGHAKYGGGAAIISAPVPAGTTATVTMTFSGDVAPVISTYRVTGRLSATAGDTISADVFSSTTYNGTIDVTNNGVMLFGGIVYSAATGYSMTGATEDYEFSIGNNQRVIGASLAVTATQTNRPVSISRTGGTGSTFSGTIVGAAFR